MQVELVYEKTCPNIGSARSQLLRAFTETGIPPRWHEWEISAVEAPAHVHGYGSPTILVDRKDVGGDNLEGDDYCCRVYSHGEANKGVPALADLVSALKSAREIPEQTISASRWRPNATTLPVIGAVFLPKLTCPACWPAYAGLLSSMGVGFFDYTPYLLPLTVIFVLVAISALIFRAKQRRGHKPFIVGVLGGAILMIGRFQYENDAAMYAGLLLLVAASVWNTWPKASSTDAKCHDCVK